MAWIFRKSKNQTRSKETAGGLASPDQKRVGSSDPGTLDSSRARHLSGASSANGLTLAKEGSRPSAPARSKVSADSWPSPETQVIVVIPSVGRVFSSVIREIDPEQKALVISGPIPQEQDDREIHLGEQMVITWTSDTGLHELRAELISSSHLHGSQWSVKPASSVVLHERRRHPRIRRGGEVRLSSPNATVVGTLLDLSEGGVHCLIDNTRPMGTTEVLDITVGLESRRITVKGWVAWKRANGRHTELGISFAGLARRDILLIQKYLDTVKRQTLRQQRPRA